MKREKFENSIENNNRKAFIKNAKRNFKEVLKRIPLYTTMYLLMDLITQYLKNQEIDFESTAAEAIIFGVIVAIVADSTEKGRKNNA